MKNIAIITYSMIPHAFSWGGCQRMYYLAEEMIKNGIDVTVFSFDNKANNTFGNDIHFRTIALPTVGRFYSGFINSKNTQEKSNDEKNKNKQSFIGSLRKKLKDNKILFKIIVNLDLWINNEPSVLMGPITRKWSKAHRRIISEYIEKNEIQSVIVSGPPFGMFSIAKYIKKLRPNVNMIIDYRDPWNLWHKKSRLALNKEKQSLKYADMVVFTNHNLEVDMKKKFPLINGKTDVVMNGFSEFKWAQIEALKPTKNERMTITYAGSIDVSETSRYGFRDVTNLFSAVEKMVKEGYRLRLEIIGANNPNSEYAQQKSMILGESLYISKMVETDEAIRKMLASDILLIIHSSNDKSSKYLVGGKLYDYIRSGKFVLSIGDIYGLNSEVVKKERIGACVENDCEKIYGVLKELYNKWINNNLTIDNKTLNVYKYSREYQNSHYIDIVNSIEKGIL